MPRSRPAALAAALALVSWGAAADPVGRFEIVLVFTDRAGELYRRFDIPDGKPLGLESIKVAPRGTRLAALVFFRNCKRDDKGLCDIELDTIAHTPDGKVYGYRSDWQFWHEAPRKPAGELELGRRTLGLVIDPGDPAGTWHVTATARDRIANTESSAEWRFEVEPE